MNIVRTDTDQSIQGQKTFDKEILTTNGVGAVGASTVKAKEAGDGVAHVTTLTLTDFVIGTLPGSAAAKTLVPASALYVLPSGAQIVEVCDVKVGLTGAGTAVTPEIGLGSVAGDGSANATIGAAGATMEDYVEGFAVATTLSHAEVESGIKTATAGALTGIALNDSTKSKNMYLNCAGTWNANNTGTLKANGVVVIKWTAIK